MRIVVLDGHTLNPGDLSWDGLKELGDCTVFDRSAADQTVARAEAAELVLTNKVVLARDVLAALPRLRYIGVLATGYNVVDIEAARERGIPVSNVPSYGTQSVAQMVFAHLLNLTQRVGHHARTVRDGRWTSSIDFCYWDTPQIELAGRTIGLIGYGRIGRATAALARAFGMDVLAHDVFLKPGDAPEATLVDLEELLKHSDVVSLHCPLTADNTGLINPRTLALMKPGAFLINTSRGPLVDEQALAEALHAGIIAGAGLDVLAVEPPRPDNPLLHAPNCFVTPHIAWATQAARQRLLDTVVGNVEAFLAGTPVNVVNAL